MKTKTTRLKIIPLNELIAKMSPEAKKVYDKELEKLKKVRSKKAKESLIEYIKENPELRLWQAIRNWSGATENSKEG